MKNSIRKILAAVLAGTILTAGLAGCASGSAASGSGNTSSGDGAAQTEEAEGAVHIIFGHGQAEGHPYQVAAESFKKEVEEATDGRVIVDIFANGSLGDEREMTESLQLGTVDMTVAVAAVLSGFDPNMDVFNFPYLFDSREQAFQVLDGEVGQEIFSGMEKEGIEIFGTFDLGFRSMTNNARPIVEPEDCKGLRIRTLESSVCVDALGCLGIDAMSMSFSELFTAMQTGTVDGQENPLFTIYNSRFYEVQKYLSLTEHFYPVCPVMVSDLMWEKVPEQDQEAVRTAISNMVDYERELAGEELDTMLVELEEKGMIINEVDKEAFKEAVQPVYDKYEDQYGELLDQIRAAEGES